MVIILKIAVFVFLMFVSAPVFAKDLGVIGVVYPIIEKDALDEIQSRAKQINWGNYFSKDKIEKIIKNHKPGDLKTLPKAKKDRIFSVDLTYALDFDIPDGSGNILYPKGYTFNPLDYVIFPNILVVIDGDDREQIDWFKGSKYAQDPSVMLLITEGSYWNLTEKLKRPVFYATSDILQKFQISNLPSVVYQKTRLMEVAEYVVSKKK